MFMRPVKTKNKPDIVPKRLRAHRIPAHVSLAERRQRELFRAMTPAQRWEQFKALRETAWKLKRAGIQSLHPELSKAEIETMVRDFFLHAST
jgi:hypothetical protein